ncbi:MAG TPA: hypothetical protein VNG70_05280 [Candidatus Limnocylindria bacterium]|nr:hypothetical protein [Candidatus Limnocylindria bacterium]
MTIAWISIWAAALLLLPGWVIWRLAGPRGMPRSLEIAPAFALSLAVISLVGWSGYALGFGFREVKAVSIVVLVLAAIGLPITLFYVRPKAREAVSPRWTLWAVGAIALGAGLSALYSGPWLSATADTFYHLAAIRSVIENNTALPKEVFFATPVRAPDPTTGTWHVALALVSDLSGHDPLSVWRVMNVALAPITVLAFFALALSITRSGIASLITTALYVVLALSFDFRYAALPNHFGNLLAWLVLTLVLRFVDNGSRRELVVAAPIAFAASAVHVTLSPFLLVSLGGAVAAAILVRSHSLKRLAVAAAIAGAAALPLLVVDISTLTSLAPYASMAVQFPPPLLVVHHPWTWVWPSNWYNNPGTVLGTAFAVSLLRFWRAGEVGAGLLIAALIAIPAAALTPLFATTSSGRYLLARVSFTLQPLAWLSWGWGIALAITALRSRPKVLAAAVLVVSAVAMAAAFYTGPLARLQEPPSSPTSFAFTRSTDLTAAWGDRLAALDRQPRAAILLAEPRMAYELAGLTGREVVAVPLSHTPYQIQAREGPRRRTDALDAVQGRLDSAGLAGVLEYYGVTDVLVDMDRTNAAAWAQLANARILIPIASGDRWRLYTYEPRMLDQFLDLPTQEGPLPQVARSGVGPKMAIAGRAVFARVQFNQGAAGNARLQAVDLGSPFAFSRAIEVGSSSSSDTYALPIPADAPAGHYQLSVVMNGGDPVPLGRFVIGRVLQAEDMGGVVAGDSKGWSVLSGAEYQGGLAAIATDPRSAASQAILPVKAGTYCLGALVYDYGTSKPNIIQVTLGSVTAQLAWAGSVPGVRWVNMPVTLYQTGGQLGMLVTQRGQRNVIVDSLEIYPQINGSCTSG